MPQPRPSHTYLHRCLLQYMTIPYLWEKLLVLFRFKGILLLLILIDICILFRLYFLRMETKCISICSLEDFLDPLSISRACGWGRRWGPGALAAEPASTLVAVSTLATHQKVTENLWNCLCSDARNVDLIWNFQIKTLEFPKISPRDSHLEQCLESLFYIEPGRQKHKAQVEGMLGITKTVPTKQKRQMKIPFLHKSCTRWKDQLRFGQEKTGKREVWVRERQS